MQSVIACAILGQVRVCPSLHTEWKSVSGELNVFGYSASLPPQRFCELTNTVIFLDTVDVPRSTKT